MTVTRIESGRFCSSCGVEYRVELTIPPEIWERVRLDDSDCRLCASCIGDRLEALCDRLEPSFALVHLGGIRSEAEFLERASDAFKALEISK